MLNRLTDTLGFQGDALVLRAERQRLIASNIANADTPGYVARDMNFAQALREASGATSGATPGSGGPAGTLAATVQAQFRAQAVAQLGDSATAVTGTPTTANLVYATASQTNLDRNTVDMDRERASFADNSVKYEATLRFINGGVRTMLDAIKGG